MNNIANTIGIRLEVSQDLYERLQTEQEKRRIKTGKKPALAAIIMDLCTIKLEENENVHSDVQTVQKSVHISEHSDSSKDKVDFNNEKRLKNWEEQLSIKNKSLQEQEKEIFKEKMGVLDLKSKVLDERDTLQQKALEGTESIIELKLFQNEAKHKDERIQRLETELSIAKSKPQRTHEDRKESQPQTLWEQIKPFLPYIAGGLALLAAYFIAQKNKKPELPPVLKELAGLFDHLSEEDQKKLGEKLKYYSDLHTAPTEENKILQLNVKQTK